MTMNQLPCEHPYPPSLPSRRSPSHLVRPHWAKCWLPPRTKAFAPFSSGADATGSLPSSSGIFQKLGLAQADQLADVIAGVVGLIENPSRPLKSGLDLHGSDFEIKVWRALQTIPPGQTLSYSALADRVGLKGVAKAAKDVADACAGNKIAVAVPCHRVLRKDGTISGYRWGVHRKRALLEREGVQ